MVLAVEFETKFRCEKMAMAKEEELFALKRPALQKMAKLHGIKANKKVSLYFLTFQVCV